MSNAETSPNLSSLLLRVEGATGADRELDHNLAAHFGWCFHPPGRQRDDSAQSDTGYTCLDCGADSWGNTGPSGQKRNAVVPTYTASLDAALALCERGLPGCLWRVEKHTPMPADATVTTFWATCGSSGSQEQAYGYTAPSALLAALLKALIAASEDGTAERQAST